MLEHGLPPDTLLNVNVPPDQDGVAPHGVALTRMGRRRYGDAIVEKVDPRGRKYYWIAGDEVPFVAEEGTDFHAVQPGPHLGHADPPRSHELPDPRAARAAAWLRGRNRGAPGPAGRARGAAALRGDQRLHAARRSVTACESGENLYRIGKAYGVDYRELAQANDIRDADRIEIGQLLVVPNATRELPVEMITPTRAREDTPDVTRAAAGPLAVHLAGAGNVGGGVSSSFGARAARPITTASTSRRRSARRVRAARDGSRRSTATSSAATATC